MTHTQMQNGCQIRVQLRDSKNFKPQFILSYYELFFLLFLGGDQGDGEGLSSSTILCWDEYLE